MHIQDMTHPYVRHHSLVCATWLLHTCTTWRIRVCNMPFDARTDSFMRFTAAAHMCHDLFICATWLIHMWDTPHSYGPQFTRMRDMTPSYVHDLTYSCLQYAFWCAKWLIHAFYSSRTYVPWLVHICDMTHSYVRHTPFIRATSFTRMRDMTHSYVRRDSFIRATWLIHTCETWRIHTCDMSFDARTDSFMRFIIVEQLHLCDMTRSCVRHDSWICATWLIHTCDMTHSYVRDLTYCTCDMSFNARTDTFMRFVVVEQLHMREMIRSYVRHDSFIYATRLIHMCKHTTLLCVRHGWLTCATWLVRMYDVTYSYVCHVFWYCVVTHSSVLF